MGEMEKESKKRSRKKKIQQAVLATVGIAGIISVAAVAPGAFMLLGAAGFKPHARQEESIRRATQRLTTRGLLEWNDGKVRLTPAGQKVHFKTQIVLRLKEKRRWDGKWRVLIFDIPERRRSTRFALRSQMQEVGFIRLQNSVWAYPHDCEDFVALLKADLKIGKDLLYLIVDSIEGDSKLRLHFSLPKK